MASDGLIFSELAHVDPSSQVPLFTIVMVAISTGFIALLVSIETLVELLSIGTLLAYTIVSISVLVLRYEAPNNIPKSRSMIAFGSTLGLVAFGFVLGAAWHRVNSLFLGIGAIGVLGSFALISYQEQSPMPPLRFQVPCVPLLPCLSILINIQLMISLNYLTWIRLVIWMGIGKEIF